MDVEHDSGHISIPFVKSVDGVANYSTGPRRDVFAILRDVFEVGEDIGESAARFATIVNGD